MCVRVRVEGEEGCVICLEAQVSEIACKGGQTRVLVLKAYTTVVPLLFSPGDEKRKMATQPNRRRVKRVRTSGTLAIDARKEPCRLHLEEMDQGSPPRRGSWCSFSSPSSSDSTQDEGATMPMDREELNDDNGECGEVGSVFHMIGRDVLYWLFRSWDPHMAGAIRLVCRRWNAVGKEAFDVFRTTQSFLYGVVLDPEHLMRLLDHPRFPPQLLEDASTTAVIFGTVKEPRALRELARRSMTDVDRWLTCFQRVVDNGNLVALECLLAHEIGARVSDKIDVLLQMVCHKQNAQVLHMVLKRYEKDMDHLLRSQAVATWCCVNSYAVTLAELLRVPVFCTTANLQLVLNYALTNHAEPLVRSVWGLGVLKARRLGSRTLMKACAHNWTDVIRMLLDQGLSPAAGGQQQALCHAAQYGHLETVTLLCADSRTKPGHQHNQPAREALRCQHHQVALYLASHDRVDPNNDGDRPEHNLLCMTLCAGSVSQLDMYIPVVKRLLERGADPNRHEHSALRFALTRKNYTALCLLVACPRVEMTREEFYQVLTALSEGNHREELQKLMQSPRFRQHFV